MFWSVKIQLDKIIGGGGETWWVNLSSSSFVQKDGLLFVLTINSLMAYDFLELY